MIDLNSARHAIVEEPRRKFVLDGPTPDMPADEALARAQRVLTIGHTFILGTEHVGWSFGDAEADTAREFMDIAYSYIDHALAKKGGA